MFIVEREFRLIVVEHVVIPLDHDHVRAAEAIAAAMAKGVGLAARPLLGHGHITLVAYRVPCRPTAVAAIEAAVAATRPFVIRAHGYGFFSGHGGDDLSLHVPVVRSRPIDALHGAVHQALQSIGAEVAGWTEPECWSPHITLVDQGLDPRSLAAGAGWLATRHHPTWRIPVDHLGFVGGRSGDGRMSPVVLLGGAGQTAPTSR